jgi:hypothetical protein
MNSTKTPPPGSVNLSQPDLFRLGTLTRDQLSTLRRPMSEDLARCISSPGSAAAPEPSNSPGGPQTGPCGLALAPASPFPAPARAKELTTTGTCGQSPLSLSKPAGRKLFSASKLHPQTLSDRSKRLLSLTRFKGATSRQPTELQTALSNRLRCIFTLDGSMEYLLIWKAHHTPAGRQIYRLRASARPTSDSDFTGWPSPKASNTTGASETETRQGAADLQTIAQLTIGGWPTPSSRDWKDTAGMKTTGTNPDGSERTRLDQLPRVAQLAGWVSPTAQDHSRGSLPPRPHDTGVPLSQQVTLAGWTTPSASDGDRGGGTITPAMSGTSLPQLTNLAFGTTSNSSPAGTEKPAASRALNPAFSRWLMGFPEAWCQAAIKASRKLKQTKPGRRV